jgi:hypothetical protein
MFGTFGKSFSFYTVSENLFKREGDAVCEPNGYPTTVISTEAYVLFAPGHNLFPPTIIGHNLFPPTLMTNSSGIARVPLPGHKVRSRIIIIICNTVYH